MRANDRDLIRGGHYGQRSCEPHSKAEHMAAPTNAALVKITLANAEPSTHDPKRTTPSCFSRLSRQGRNHHNFNEHPRSPKVRGEASPHRRIFWIDPFIPNRIVIFEQTHVSDPDLGA